jgi:hypothetical protein
MGRIDFQRKNLGTPDNNLGNVLRAPGAMAGVVINVSWWQIEPEPDRRDFAVIDKALSAVRAYNANYPSTPLKVRLRVWPGIQAPDWAQRLEGDPVSIYRRENLVTIGRWWTDKYRKAWRATLAELARRYDDESLIVSVTASSCATQTDEPFVSTFDPISALNMAGAGYTTEAYRNCLLDAINDFEPWSKTRIELPINPFHDRQNGKVLFDLPFTLQVMAYWRKAFGAQVELSNHAVNSPPVPRLVPIYEAAARLGPPITYQTRAPARALDWQGALEVAAQHKANSVELWVSKNPDRLEGWEQFPADQLAAWTRLLSSNPLP